MNLKRKTVTVQCVRHYVDVCTWRVKLIAPIKCFQFFELNLEDSVKLSLLFNVAAVYVATGSPIWPLLTIRFQLQCAVVNEMVGS